MTKLLAIVGQTASGKSSLAMRVAKQFDGEIIAADSRTVYKGLDIGTAKPTVDDMQQVRHHTIDVVDYGQSFTVADFKRLAHQAIFDIQERGKLPMLVGGSGLYLNSVLYDYELGGPADEGMRRELSGLTVHELQRRIVQTGIEMPENSQNKRYLIRAIERAGKGLGSRELPEETIVVGLKRDRPELEQRIRSRLAQMLDEGLMGEVEKALTLYTKDSEALKGNIYRALRPLMNQDTDDLDACLEEFVRLDLALAKKQWNWFKRDQNIVWFTSSDEAFEHLCEKLAGQNSVL